MPLKLNCFSTARSFRSRCRTTSTRRSLPRCERFGSGPFEAIYLAAERGAVLISDDLHYRSLAAACSKVRSGWIQAFLIAASRSGDVSSPEYVRHVARLAHLRHNLVQFDAKLLTNLFESNPDPELVDFKAVCRYLGGSAASMWNHSLIVAAFLRNQWNKTTRDPRFDSGLFNSPHFLAAKSCGLAGVACACFTSFSAQGSRLYCRLGLWSFPSSRSDPRGIWTLGARRHWMTGSLMRSGSRRPRSPRDSAAAFP